MIADGQHTNAATSFGTGDIASCPSCVYFDHVHPSAVTQGFLANEVIELVNAAFDPGGTMPIEPLSNIELFNLTQLVAVPVGPVAALGIAAALLAAGVARLRRRRIG